jgi:small multidrug resistance family-3 protein
MPDKTGGALARSIARRVDDAVARSLLVHIAAAPVEIAGCFGLWLWHGRSTWVLVAARASPTLLALLDNPHGRTYVVYGNVYIAASLGSLWLVGGVRPGRWGVAGACLRPAGAALIVFGPRSA